MDVKTYDELVDMIYAATGSANMWCNFGRRPSIKMKEFQLEHLSHQLQCFLLNSSTRPKPCRIQLVIIVFGFMFMINTFHNYI